MLTGASLVTTSEAAAALGVTRRQVGKLIKAGALPAVNVGSGRRAAWRVAADDLATLLVERSTP